MTAALSIASRWFISNKPVGKLETSKKSHAPTGSANRVCASSGAQDREKEVDVPGIEPTTWPTRGSLASMYQPAPSTSGPWHNSIAKKIWLSRYFVSTSQLPRGIQELLRALIQFPKQMLVTIHKFYDDIYIVPLYSLFCSMDKLHETGSSETAMSKRSKNPLVVKGLCSHGLKLSPPAWISKLCFSSTSKRLDVQTSSSNLSRISSGQPSVGILIIGSITWNIWNYSVHWSTAWCGMKCPDLW